MPRFDIVCPNDVVTINTSMLLQALGQLHPTTEFRVREVEETRTLPMKIFWSTLNQIWTVRRGDKVLKTCHSKSEAEEWLDENN